MSDDAKAKSPPAKRGRGPAANTTVPDQGDLAARLFVKLYSAGGGRTPTHYAETAIKAAEAFLEVYEKHR